MAQDAAQEECERGVRHAEPRRYRDQFDRPGDHRELPNAALSAQRARQRAADRARLRTVRPYRPPDRAIEPGNTGALLRSEETTSELQSLMRSPYAVFCL